MPKVETQESLFRRLTRLFRSGPVVKRKIRTADTTMAVPNKDGSSGAMLFQKSLSPTYATITGNAYNLSERLMRYQDFCFTGDTLVATNDESGCCRLDELVRRWNDGERDIMTFSYDVANKSVVSSKITGAKHNGKRKIVSVLLDDGSEIRCTPDHRFMLKNGTYVEAQDLKEGTALMRFSRSNFNTPYRYVQTHRRGWKPEHVLVAEAIAGRECLPGEHVHHKNFRQKDNTSKNLEIMLAHDHMSLHAKINNLRFLDPSQHARQSEIMKSRWQDNGDMRLNFSKNLEKNRENLRNSRIKFNKTFRPGRFNANRKDQIGLMNGNADKSLTYQSICDAFMQGDSIKSLSKRLQTSEYKIRKRLLWEGFNSFKEFSTGYENHKVVAVVDRNETEDVFDIEVKDYSNFALAKKDDNIGAQGIVIVHNCEMEYTPEIASALDIYADECVAQDEKGRVLHIYSDNSKVKEILEDLFYNVLNVEFNLRSWARNLAKYGDFFLYVDVSPQYGVINCFPIPVNEIEREENFDRNDPFAVRYRWTSLGNRTLENWEVAHMRLLGNDMFLPYGSSLIEAARRIWRQLILIEDAMLVYRIVRAPDRRVFYIDVGAASPDEIPRYLEEAKKTLRTNQVIDNQTGRVDLRYNPLSIDEDYFIPTRGGESGTKIENLAGGQNTAAVEDVQYIQKKLFSALKVPKAYLGYDEMLSSKSTLAQEDIRFSRTISVIQKTMIAELNKIAMIHLYSHGYDGEELLQFNLKLSNPSTIAQQQKLELYKSRFDIAGSAPEGMVSKRYIRKEILGLTDEQIESIEKERIDDKLTDAAVEAATPEENEEGPEGGPGGAGGAPEAAPEEKPEEKPEKEEKPEEPVTAGGDMADEEQQVLTSGNKVKKDGTPIRANPQSDRQRQKYNAHRKFLNSKISRGAKGPDFKKTLGSKDTFKDPHGKLDLDAVISPSLNEADVVSRPKPSTDMLATLSKMSRHFGMNNEKNVLLKEDMQEDYLFEVDENDE
jgi:hypothetical protein